MKTREQIKDELRQIKYYYSRSDKFEANSKRIIGNRIIELVNEYNELISMAPAMLYDIYISIYTENCTQACVAEDLYVTPEYVSRLNGQLVKYFEEKFNEN